MPQFTATVAQSSDDGHQNTNGSMDLTYEFYINAGASRYAALRFQNVTVPQGATIDSAYIKVLPHHTDYDSPNNKIYCQAADNAGTLTTDTNNISSRTRTTAYATWDADDIGTGTYKTSPDIKAAVQEVIDRGGWASGNALMVIMTSEADSQFLFRGYDFGANRPQIEINYVVVEGGSGKPNRVRTVPFMTKQPLRGGW